MGSAANVFVTGGAGFIGSHACLALSRAGFTPVVYDNLLAGDKARVQWGPFVEGDIKSPLGLLAALRHYKPVAVMHFAGQISVAESVKNPIGTYQNNVGGTLMLLHVMKEAEIRHMVFSSSAAVYGAPAQNPIGEDAPKSPVNPYGQSKLMAEQMLEGTSGAGLLSYAALRYFNAAGATPEHALGYKRADATHLIPLALMAVLGQRPPLELYGGDYPTPDGTAVRDYVHVADLAEAHVLALKHLLGGGEDLRLNLGTSKGHSVKEVLAAVEKVTGKPVPQRAGPRRAGDPAELVADATRAGQVLGWKPAHSGLEEIVASDWDWHRKLYA